jgi:intron-binding protein aquarius
LADFQDFTDGSTRFDGHARMALPLKSFGVTVVRKPRVGESVPAEVTAEIVYSVGGLQQKVRDEWDDMKQFECLFLVRL